jgi:hypothetical protein
MVEKIHCDSCGEALIPIALVNKFVSVASSKDSPWMHGHIDSAFKPTPRLARALGERIS